MRLRGKVALISGGSRGLGAAGARLFCREGARVIIADVLEKEGRKLETEINEAGGESIFSKLDVTSYENWNLAVKASIDRFGKLDVLVNNAGVMAPNTVENTTSEQWDRTMEVNAKGVFLGTKAVIPELRRNSGGSIINISSMLGLVGSTIAAAYTASKGAVRMLTKASAIQYAKEGIRINSVHPGTIETDMMRQALKDDKTRAWRMEQIPMRRFGHPDDIAYGMLFLASDESSFMTGSELIIDGGFTAQ